MDRNIRRRVQNGMQEKKENARSLPTRIRKSPSSCPTTKFDKTRFLLLTAIGLYVCISSKNFAGKEEAKNRIDHAGPFDRFNSFEPQSLRPSPNIDDVSIPCHVQFLNPFFTEYPEEVFQGSPGDLSCGGKFKPTLTHVFSEDEIRASEGALKNGNINGTSAHVDVYMTHYRNWMPRQDMLMKQQTAARFDGSIRVLWGYENAVYSPRLTNSKILRHFDYLVNANVDVAAVPINLIRLPPNHGNHAVPPYKDRPNFAMFTWSHCELVRTEYAHRMMNYSSWKYNLNISSMGKCFKNSDGADILQTTSDCPNYNDDTNWHDLVIPNQECDRKSFSDVAGRSYKFILIFENADCNSWMDEKVMIGWSSGAIVVFMGTSKLFLQRFIPPALLDAMMFVEDYPSPDALVDAMVAIDENEFTRRTAWTTEGYDRSLWYQAFHGTDHVICQLCRLRFENGTLQDGTIPPKNKIQIDNCTARKYEDWL